MESRLTRHFNAFDLVIGTLLGVNIYNFTNDIDYWLAAPFPFYAFLWIQLLAILLLIRTPCTKFSSRCKDITLLYSVVIIFMNTILGTYQFVRLCKDHEDFLKTFYYAEALVLLGIPLIISTFFVLAVLIAIIMI